MLRAAFLRTETRELVAPITSPGLESFPKLPHAAALCAGGGATLEARVNGGEVHRRSESRNSFQRR
jgi:hypothetical protein